MALEAIERQFQEANPLTLAKAGETIAEAASAIGSAAHSLGSALSRKPGGAARALRDKGKA